MIEAKEHFFTCYEYNGIPIYEQFQDLISDETLPFDAAFRLAGIGLRQVDSYIEHEYPRTLSWMLLEDIVAHASDPEAMRPDARKLLFGERPSIVIDDNIFGNKRSYTELDPMYYRLGNLATIIKEDRADRGKTITEIPSHWYDTTPKEHEWRTCVRIARPIWRVIINRTRPEILNNPQEYVMPTMNMFQVYNISDNTARRRAIGMSVVCDTVVMKIHQEAEETGVRGIGPNGRRHLRQLLSDEHPELL